MVLTSAVKVKGYVCFSKWVSAREYPHYGSSILCAVKVVEQSLDVFGPGRLAPFQTDLGMVQEMAQARDYSQQTTWTQPPCCGGQEGVIA